MNDFNHLPKLKEDQVSNLKNLEVIIKKSSNQRFPVTGVFLRIEFYYTSNKS